MPLFRLLGVLGGGQILEKRAVSSASSAEKIIWSRAPGAMAVEVWVTGLLVAFTGWDLVALMLKHWGLSTLMACLVAVPIAFVGFHLLPIVATAAVERVSRDPADPSKWVHRVCIAIFTAAAIAAAPICPGVWPWLGWMVLNAVAWVVLRIWELSSPLESLDTE